MRICKYEYHKMSNTLAYRSWQDMKIRCYNKSYIYYHRYGGRGIIVCERWRNSFKNFLKDMGPKPFPKAQIDRKDNDGNYEPGNCMWSSQIDNCRHQSTTILTMMKAKGIRNRFALGDISRKELSSFYGITYATICDVLNQRSWRTQ